ncbi:MAG: 2-dehydropantoate 2-reductase [Thermodesulfobacteriota bacterium]
MVSVVVGPGSLGCLFAAFLAADAGAEVWLLDKRPERAAYLAAQGIIIEAAGRTRRVRVRATAQPGEIPACDLVLLTVKAHAVAAALARLPAGLFRPQGLLVTLENGIAHLPLLATWTTAPAALGVTAQGATLLATGQVRHAGQGPTWLGFSAAVSQDLASRLEAVAAHLTRVGLPAQVAPDILGQVWLKLMVNAGINALTALLDCPNGALPERPEARALLEQAVAETVAVARKKGVAVPEDPVAMTVAVCQATAANISSMLQDVRAGRPTEIEAINGAVAAEARRLGMAAPVNEALCRAVQAVSAGRPPEMPGLQARP